MEKVLKIIDRIVIILASILLVILIGCLSVLPIGKSKSFYMKEHIKNDVVGILNEYTFTGRSFVQVDEYGNSVTVFYPNMEVDMTIVEKATDNIINYLYNKDVESMQFEIEGPDGKMYDFFTPQAIIHMKDVKVLFIGGITLAYISIVLFILAVVYLVIRRNYIKDIVVKWYSRTLIGFIIFLLCIVAFALISFDAAFTVFHYLIFNSADAELAISFSYYDTLTNVLTEDFFIHIGIIIGITFIGLLIISVIIGKVLEKYGKSIINKLFKKEA